jgi:hypothetical protein
VCPSYLFSSSDVLRNWSLGVGKPVTSAPNVFWQVLDSEEFQKPLLEKLIWISSFMLVGARHPGATVGDVEANHREEVAKHILQST